MSESTYYIKLNNRYIPVGCTGPALYDGIWLVQSSNTGTRHSNIIMRMANIPDCYDLQILAKTTMLEQIISDIISNAWADGKSESIANIAMKIAAQLAIEENKLTIKQFRG